MFSPRASTCHLRMAFTTWRIQLTRSSMLVRAQWHRCVNIRVCLRFLASVTQRTLQIFIFIGALESINHEGKLSISDMHKDSTREVAQFSLPIYGASQLKGKSPALVEELKLKELQNGRLAMLGKYISSILVLPVITFCPRTFPSHRRHGSPHDHRRLGDLRSFP